MDANAQARSPMPRKSSSVESCSPKEALQNPTALTRRNLPPNATRPTTGRTHNANVSKPQCPLENDDISENILLPNPHQYDLSFTRSDASSRLPPECRSLLAMAVDQHFFACFMISYHKSSLLPSIFAEYKSSPTLIYACRAGTMAFYGKLTSNLSIQMDASRWYEKALQVQIKKLDQNPVSKTSPVRNVEELLRPMMMCLFESSICTSMMGWVHHVGAGAKMLETIGPKACQTNPMHNIFLTLRLNSVGVALLQVYPFNLLMKISM
jgi:hypothetical protein